MLLVLNRGGPGSYRSRQRRGVISQEETRFYPAKYSSSLLRDAQQIDPRSLTQHFQNSGVRLKTTHRTRRALPACCGGEV